MARFDNILSKLRRVKFVPPTEHHVFDPTTLDSSFNNLQSILHETSCLANAISATLDSRDIVEKKLSTVLQVIADGIVIMDNNGIIQEWNAGAENIFGYSAADIIGCNISEISGHKSSEYLIDRRATNYEDHIHRICSKRKDGTLVVVEIIVNTILDNDNTVSSYVAVIRDITKKANHEEEEKKKLQIISTIVSESCNLIIVKDAVGRWTHVNEVCKIIFNFASDRDWKNQIDSEIAHCRPELADAFHEFGEYDAKAWELQKSLHSEESIRIGNLVHHFSVTRTPLFDDNGDKNALVFIAKDITDLIEKRQHAYIAYKALNASTDLVAITDRHGDIIFVNDSFIRAYKYIDQHDLIGRNMSILHSAHTTNETYEKLWSTIKAGRVFHRKLINVDRYGSEIKVENTIMPVINKELDTPFFICISKLLD